MNYYSNPLGKPQRGRTAVTYVVEADAREEGVDVLHVVVYDRLAMEQASFMGKDLVDSMLGYMEVEVAPGRCHPLLVVARPGFGPLVYDLAARGLAKFTSKCDALSPSEALTQFSKAFWQRREMRPIEPLSVANFTAKYGMKPTALEAQGRKMHRGKARKGFGADLVEEGRAWAQHDIWQADTTGERYGYSRGLDRLGYRP